jgi:hypothetical protein
LENTFSVPSARNMGILAAKYDYIGTWWVGDVVVVVVFDSTLGCWLAH